MNRFKKLFQKPGSYKLKGLEYKDFDWDFSQEHSNEFTHVWFDKNSSAAIFFHYFGLEPDVLTVKDVDKLRESIRESISESNGAIIKLEIGNIQNVVVVEQILKFPMEHQGMAYVGSIIIPYKNCSYVLKVQCPEVGTTGIRDSTIFSKMINEGVITLEGGIIPKGWAKDPYDETITGGVQMNLSEEEQYDKMFPEHPLSIVRNIMAQFTNLVKLDTKLERFEK